VVVFKGLIKAETARRIGDRHTQRSHRVDYVGAINRET
jgi:hypothetical protein